MWKILNPIWVVLTRDFFFFFLFLWNVRSFLMIIINILSNVTCHYIFTIHWPSRNSRLNEFNSQIIKLLSPILFIFNTQNKSWIKKKKEAWTNHLCYPFASRNRKHALWRSNAWIKKIRPQRWLQFPKYPQEVKQHIRRFLS